MGEAFAFRAERGTMQHVKRCVPRQMRPEGYSLIEMRDEEVPAAGCGQRRRDASRAKAVGIGLDHGSA